jgi:hypothetical protein
MIDDRNPSGLHDVRTTYRAEAQNMGEAERALIDRAIDEGLASPPSKRSVAEIMAAERAAIG